MLFGKGGWPGVEFVAKVYLLSLLSYPFPLHRLPVLDRRHVYSWGFGLGFIFVDLVSVDSASGKLLVGISVHYLNSTRVRA